MYRKFSTRGRQDSDDIAAAFDIPERDDAIDLTSEGDVPVERLPCIMARAKHSLVPAMNSSLPKSTNTTTRHSFATAPLSVGSTAKHNSVQNSQDVIDISSNKVKTSPYFHKPTTKGSGNVLKEPKLSLTRSKNFNELSGSKSSSLPPHRVSHFSSSSSSPLSISSDSAFDDTNLGLSSKHTTFSNTRRVGRGCTVPANETPTLSKGDFDVSLSPHSSVQKRKKSSEDEVIVCQGDSSPLSTNKQHSKRWRKGDSLLFNPDQDLQRRQLGKTDQRHKYNMPYDEVIKNAEANVSKKGKEPTRTLSKPTYLSTTLSYGKLRTPILRKSKNTVLLPLLLCQVGLLKIDYDPKLEVLEESIRLKFEHDDIIADCQIHFIDIRSLKHFDMKMLSLMLHPPGSKRINDYFKSKLKLEDDCYTYSTQQCAKSVINLLFKRREEKLAPLISHLEKKVALCGVEDISEEDMEELLSATKPTRPPRKQHIRDPIVYPQSEFSSHIEDKSANGRDTTKSHNSASFYGKKDNSDPTYLPKIPPTHRTAKQSIRLKKPDPQSDNDHLVADSPVSSNSSPLRRSTRLSTHRKEAAIKKPNVKLLDYKPKGCKVGVELMTMDVETLEPGEYLNDKVMEFYFKYMMYEMLEEELQPKLHIFSSFFYTRLSNTSMDDKALSTPQRIHNRVKTWTRHVDLFSKDYIVIPVCDRAHWYVVFVCQPGKFDPSKIMPKKLRLRRKKPRKNLYSVKKKRKPKETPGGTVELLSTSQDSTGGEEMEVEDSQEDNENPLQESPCVEKSREECKDDPLHVLTYLDNDEEEEEEEEEKGEGRDGEMANGGGQGISKEEMIPGEVIARASGNMALTEQQSITDSQAEKAISIPDTPSPPGLLPSTTNISTPVHLGGVEMWEGALDSSPQVHASPTKPIINEGSQENAEREGESQTAVECEMEPEETAMDCENEEKDKEEIKNEIKEEEEEEEDHDAIGLKPSILLLDSLGVRRPTAVHRVRQYLTEEWKVKKKDSGGEMTFDHLPLAYPHIPLQNNSSDCGIFVLQYIETLITCLQESKPLPQDSDGWGNYLEIKQKRKKIEQLIMERRKT